MNFREDKDKACEMPPSAQYAETEIMNSQQLWMLLGIYTRESPICNKSWIVARQFQVLSSSLMNS